MNFTTHEAILSSAGKKSGAVCNAKQHGRQKFGKPLLNVREIFTREDRSLCGQPAPRGEGVAGVQKQ